MSFRISGTTNYETVVIDKNGTIKGRKTLHNSHASIYDFNTVIFVDYNVNKTYVFNTETIGFVELPLFYGSYGGVNPFLNKNGYRSGVQILWSDNSYRILTQTSLSDSYSIDLTNGMMRGVVVGDNKLIYFYQDNVSLMWSYELRDFKNNIIHSGTTTDVGLNNVLFVKDRVIMLFNEEYYNKFIMITNSGTKYLTTSSDSTNYYVNDYVSWC
jgi:hypothetical protein